MKEKGDKQKMIPIWFPKFLKQRIGPIRIFYLDPLIL